MTGMKEGAGGDPFADDESDNEPTPPLEETPGRPGKSDGESTAPSEESPPQDESDSGTDTNQPGRSTEAQAVQIPYKFRREGVQDGRNRVPLFLQEETKRREREVLRELEGRFDEDVTLTDLREAVVKVGLEYSDDVASQLKEWGYGITFDDN